YNDSLALSTPYAAYIAQPPPAKVTANPVVNFGVTNETRGGANPKVMVLGNIYGGGNSAPIDGNTKVDVRGNRTDIRGSVYGGGNAAIVTGNTNVIIGDRE
ncbi:MAG: hypothetical protein IKS44_01655, partial [Bacteroidales bacterium]|nr:hypothetical protein [Bacteroidales bacterium]